MGYKKVCDKSLQSVADAIRERGGTSEELVFPDGYVEAVGAIPDKMHEYLNGTLTEVYDADYNGKKTYAFTELTSLKSVDFPNATTVGYMSFSGCSALENVNMPKLTTIPERSFLRATKLAKMDCPLVESIGEHAFNSCALHTLILRKTDAICTLANTNALLNTAIAGGTGYIYVPSALINTYMAATNWSTYANQFRAIEDYPDITGVSFDKEVSV